MCNKTIMVNVVSFILGGGVGFLVGKKLYEGYYANIAQEEIDSVKDTFTKSNPIKVRKKNDEGEEKEEKAVKERDHNNPLARSSLDANPYEQAKRNYNLVKPPEDAPDEDEEDEGEYETVTDDAGKTEEEMNLTEVDRTEPYIINDREFSEEFDHHDKISLYYYRIDDVLSDEDEETIEDIEEQIGYHALSQLVERPTTVWVRNEPLCIDYEIMSINKSYAETVHGIGLEPNLSPRERYLKQQKEE